jgi:hypothetical protein
MLKRIFFLVICVYSIIFAISCNTLSKKIAYSKIEKPDTSLFNTLDNLIDENDYLVFSYTVGVIIEDYSYELQMESQKSFNIWSFTGSSEDINCFVFVKINDEIVAQIYSTDEGKKARIIENGFRGRTNGNVIFLNNPSRRKLVDAYNKMMNGEL